MILKLLLIIAVITVVYIMFFKKPSVKNTTHTAKKKNTPEIDEMVECAECGVYVSLEESILSNGKYYCSSECVAKAK